MGTKVVEELPLVVTDHVPRPHQNFGSLEVAVMHRQM
jgi:hypothetical protein